MTKLTFRIDASRDNSTQFTFCAFQNSNSFIGAFYIGVVDLVPFSWEICLFQAKSSFFVKNAPCLFQPRINPAPCKILVLVFLFSGNSANACQISSNSLKTANICVNIRYIFSERWRAAGRALPTRFWMLWRNERKRIGAGRWRYDLTLFNVHSVCVLVWKI